MNVVACIYQVPDPERPVHIEAGAMAPTVPSDGYLVGPFDENALELALQMRDRFGGRAYALSAGGDASTQALRKALAVTADEAQHIEVDTAPLDSDAVATLLAARVAAIGDVNLVLCGRQGGDWDAGQVGLLLAEKLGWPAVSLITTIEDVVDGAMVVRQTTEGGPARVRVTLPAVATVTNDPGNQLRMAKVRDIMQSRNKPITTSAPADLEVDAAPAVVLMALHRPPDTSVEVEFVEGESADEQAARLAERIAALVRR